MVTTESRQKVMKMLGEYGCYFLSLVHLAENITGKRIDAVAVYLNALKHKWTDTEATMLNPTAILSDMTGLRFSIAKEAAGYAAGQNEYEILLFNNSKYQHFVLGNGQGAVAYDPLGNSNTVASGTLTGKRIFRKI